MGWQGLLCCIAFLVTGEACGVRAAETRFVLVEAEAFGHQGGWVVDAQFMDQMGSPFLLAHGLGRPVAAAKTMAEFPAAGAYRVWVRTRNWVRNGEAAASTLAEKRDLRGTNGDAAPGRFRVRVNGRPLATVFGTGGDGSWQWHDGGTVAVGAGPSTLELEDLTGFEGRCDAILFALDAPGDFRPPNAGEEMDSLRRTLLGLPQTPPEAEPYDFVVVGGGYAGTCAAVASARRGLRVALVQDRPVLGGNASSEVGVTPIGRMDVGPFPHNADIVKLFRGGDDSSVLRVVEAEPNVRLYLNTRACGVEKDGARIAAVLTRDVRTGQARRLRAPLFADCTGDATIGSLAGADWRLGREGRDETGESLAPPRADSMLLGTSNYWKAQDTGEPQPFAACPWALHVTKETYELSPVKYPPNLTRFGPPGPGVAGGGWNWESGFAKDPIAQAEYVRDHNLRAIYGTWDYLKNRSDQRQEYANARLVWVAYVAGKRESRRLLGDVILRQQDILEGKAYPDACVGCSWYFDLHFPHPVVTREFPGEEWRSIAFDDPHWDRLMPGRPGKVIQYEPYGIPYRCLYSRNVSNLFMAGRNISVTHAALAPVRVMRTTGMMGAVVGRAASLCHKYGIHPRTLYEQRLADLKQLLANP